jgi:hypothetical protein
MISIPNPIIVFFPDAGTGWLRKIKPIRPSPQRSRNPHRTVQPIPTFDRRALRERVDQFLKQNRLQREQLRAAGYALRIAA